MQLVPITTKVVSLNPAQAGALDTLCDQVCQLLAAGQWFSPGSLVSSTDKADPYDITDPYDKADPYDITEVVLNTINQIKVINLCNVIY